MPQCIVIADDLTGANAAGVLLEKAGYTVCTILNPDRIAPFIPADCDCVLYPTNSRGSAPEIACERVHQACRRLKGPDVKLYAKRIDSTLRGNLGIETDAMLDSLGDDYTAIVAPCFPAAGRIVVDGQMLVDGVALDRTDTAADPKTPVHCSEVSVLFAQQSRYPVSSVFAEDMARGKEALADLMLAQVHAGSRILTLDCATGEDLDLIAEAVLASGLKIVAVDPGMFTAALAKKMLSPTPGKAGRILAVVGSVHPSTAEQMEALLLTGEIQNVFVQTRALLEGERQREAEIARVADAVLSSHANDQVFAVTGDGILPGNRIDFRPYTANSQNMLDEVTGRINRSFGEIAVRIFEQEPSFHGLYTSGGDITVAVCEQFQAAGLCLLDEVLPLAAYGRLLQGRFPDTHIVTKGGSQGGRDAIIRCIAYLKERISYDA